MGDSNSSTRAFSFAPLRIFGIEETKGGGLKATVEAVRPGPVNQFNVLEKFIDATMEKWSGVDLVTTHDTQARVDVVAGTITAARKDPETKALLLDIETDPDTELGRHVAAQIRKGRAAVSIGAHDPVLATDPETTDPPWDVLDGTPDHLMVTRQGHQAQKSAQILEIHASIGDALASLYGVEGEEVNAALDHNSEVADTEPPWGDVDKTKLPLVAFVPDAPGTDENAKSTWKFPHHWVDNGSGEDDNGVFTEGDLFLHKGGLNAAWSAAQGGRSGEKASAEVIAHLTAHRKALGLDGEDGEETDMEGVDHPQAANRALNRMLKKAIDALVKNDTTRADVVEQMARAAGIGASTVNKIIEGKIKCPPLARLRAFARVLKISFDSIKRAGTSDGCPYDAEAALIRHLQETGDINGASFEDLSLITLQGGNSQETNDMSTKELEETMKTLEAENASLKAEAKELAAARDDLKAQIEAAEIADLVSKTQDIEASMGKKKNELTKVEGLTLDGARAAYVGSLEAFHKNPPKVAPRVQAVSQKMSGSENLPKKLRPLFARGTIAQVETEEEEA